MMFKFLTGVIMGMVITAFSYIAVTVHASTVKLPFTLMAILLVLIAITIYLAYRFYQQEKRTQY